ncbi:VanW family protein [Paenibacillus sp. GSMTC-2017]|uniref:VanW family protein n=1 Tax=Paenibacillus sp. GSMTC-2017 TaxID=2794350 RepID=UPI0018D90CDB|nr:VanW family protein [Paenibacillus sp. GSMTC-2017]MBH5320648.1 VanW family protein [Paenibacillus sp. GSMTC-2017]
MKKFRFTITIILSVLILLLAIGMTLIWRYSNQDSVPEGVHTGVVALGGMSIDQAIDFIDKYERSLLARKITVVANQVANDKKSWDVTELGYRAEFVGAREGLLKLREGSLWDRALYRYKFSQSYTLSQSWDQEALDAALREQWGWIEKNESKNARRFISDTDEVQYEAHSDAYRLDIDGLLSNVNGWILLQEKAIGRTLTNEDKLFHSPLPIKVIQPEITLEKLKAEGIDRKIISYTTSFATSAEGRAHNVTVTAETLHDWYLAPGETFSYSKLIAEAEKRHTYKEAPVILNGKFVPGIGGGICQVSSTLYQAVLRSGLDIVSRRNHSLPVAYMPVGQDATYATDTIDFKFRNNTGKAILIRTEVKNRKLTVKLFGSKPANEHYDIESITLETIPSKTQQVVNAELPVGKSVIVEKGKPGFIVETFRTLIRDGISVSRERVSKDTYRAQPTIIEVGPDSLHATPAPPANPTPTDGIVEDGI